MAENNICSQKDTYSKSKKNACELLVETTVLSTSINCAPLAMTAGLSALQTVGPAKLAELSLRFPKLILSSVRLLQTANLVTLPITIWTLTSFGLAALDKDKKCFDNIEFKTLELNLLKLNSEVVKNKILNLSDFDKRQLEFSSEYLTEDFIKNISCQRLQQMGLEQKRKFDPIISKALVDKKISDDPRTVLKVDVDSLQSSILSNLDCWPAEKKINAICTAGNTILLAKTMLYKNNINNSNLAADLATQRTKLIASRQSTAKREKALEKTNVDKFFDPEPSAVVSPEKIEVLKKINSAEQAMMASFDKKIIDNLNNSGMGVGKTAVYSDQFGGIQSGLVTGHTIDLDGIWLNISRKVVSESGRTSVIKIKVPASDAMRGEL